MGILINKPLLLCFLYARFASQMERTLPLPQKATDLILEAGNLSGLGNSFLKHLALSKQHKWKRTWNLPSVLHIPIENSRFQSQMFKASVLKHIWPGWTILSVLLSPTFRCVKSQSLAILNITKLSRLVNSYCKKT